MSGVYTHVIMYCVGTGMEHPGLPGLAIIVQTGHAPNSKLLLAPEPPDHCFFGSVYQVP